jgi:hypothetical protein
MAIEKPEKAKNKTTTFSAALVGVVATVPN